MSKKKKRRGHKTAGKPVGDKGVSAFLHRIGEGAFLPPREVQVAERNDGGGDNETDFYGDYYHYTVRLKIRKCGDNRKYIRVTATEKTKAKYLRKQLEKHLTEENPAAKYELFVNSCANVTLQNDRNGCAF